MVYDEINKDWEIEVEHILKEGSFNSRFRSFGDKFNQEDFTLSEEWKQIFNAFFTNLLEVVSPFACCILAFRAGMVWQKYGDELD